MAKYISAEIAKKALAESDLIPRYAESCKPITDRIIDLLTAADVEPVRHGRWIWHEESFDYECPDCHCRFDYSKTHELFDHGFQFANYCPNCGAKMDGGAEDG